MVTSQAIDSSQAAARQKPCTAAIVGLGLSQKRMITARSPASAWRHAATPSVDPAASSFRSMPALKARPAPDTTTAPMSSSVSMRSNTWCSSRFITALIAFSRVGRLSSMCATWSCSVTRSVSKSIEVSFKFMHAPAPRLRAMSRNQLQV